MNRFALRTGLALALSVPLLAQYPGLRAREGAIQRNLPLGSGLPRLAPIPPLGMPLGDSHAFLSVRPPHPEGRFLYSLPFAAYPVGAPTATYYYAPQLNVVVMPPAAEAERTAEVPPAPVNSRLKEYNWPEPVKTPEAGKPEYFVLVLRDGSTRSASALWVQGDEIHYIDARGGHESVPVAALDRDATVDRNRESGIRIFLP